jgi:hypothetical protein
MRGGPSGVPPDGIENGSGGVENGSETQDGVRVGGLNNDMVGESGVWAG